MSFLAGFFFVFVGALLIGSLLWLVIAAIMSAPVIVPIGLVIAVPGFILGRYFAHNPGDDDW